MFDDLFDSPWKILIVAIVIIVLFGSRKLPDTARSIGRSMRILKAELRDGHDDTPAAASAQAAWAAPAQPQAAIPASDDLQAQIAVLQEQLASLRQQTADADGAAPAGTRTAA
jgi:sec-independent protein translocase protein TatA